MAQASTKPVFGWHFLLASMKLNHGDSRSVEVGRWLTVKDKPVLCHRGLHASSRLIDAEKLTSQILSGRVVLCRVQLAGAIVKGKDKMAATRRKVLAVISWDDPRVVGAWKAYDEAMATAEKAYNKAMAPAEKAHDEAMATAGKAYDEAMATAEKAYNKAKAPAEKAYDEAKAAAWKAYDEAKAPAEKALECAILSLMGIKAAGGCVILQS